MISWRRPFAGLLLALSILVPVSLPALATAELETPAPDTAWGTGDGHPTEPVLISEASAVPYIAGQTMDARRLQANAVFRYIARYNQRLESDEVTLISRAIMEFSARYGVDYRLLTSLIAVESAFRRDAVSSAGAIGLGQLKPATAKWLGVTDPYSPVDNVAGTARFLAWLIRKYSGNLELAISAYYQGPGFVDRNGIAPVCMPYLEKINRALGPLM